MKRKLLIILTIILFIVVLTTGIIIYKKNTYPKTRFVLDNENKFEIIRPSLTLSDGGSFAKWYYQIDLNENIVIECVDTYDGSISSKKKGYVYKGKIENIKTLTQAEKHELKSILEQVTNNVSNQSDKQSWDYALLKSFNKEDIEIYDKDIRNKLIELLQAE